MSNLYEQRFFSALKDTFIGHPIKGKSGYVNLMDIKAQYFAEIEPYIKAEIDKQIDAKFREELFEKLYNFFDCYLNETGTVFFANSQIHKNLYEKVYSDRDDVALFWKTQKLYYVKSEANYEDLQTEVNGIKILFDASEIKHAKGNEKKAIQFYLVKATKDELIFKVRYQESNKYDRLKDYLELDKNNDLIDKCLDDYGTDLHPNIIFANTDIDRTVIDKKTDSRKCLFIENLDDALSSVKVEYSINDLSLILTYLHKKGIILYDEDLRKIFSIYKRQNEIDYFIHKDAEGFLKEQFDIYVYNWLFNDLDTDFDAATVKRMQNIKKIAHKVIEYIARFEDELKAIWEKPKFVRNCNYVITLDKLADNVALIKKIIGSPGWENQVIEWQELNKEWLDDKGETTKKEWNEFAFSYENGFENNIIVENKLNEKYQFLPIDTKFFIEVKFQILNIFENLDSAIDGVLIKSDNWQALNTIKDKYSEKIDLVYIDPPFNTGSDFEYKDKYQNSTWCTLIENRLILTKEIISSKGNFYLHLDHSANHLGRILGDKYFYFGSEIIWQYGGKGLTNTKTNFVPYYGNIFHFKNADKTIFNNKIGEITASVISRFGKYFDENNQVTFKKLIDNNENAEYEKALKSFKKNNDREPEPEDIAMDFNGGSMMKDIWTDIGIIRNNPTYLEALGFDTQKPEKLLERIIMSSSNKNSLVIDYFSGSATTIATAHKMKRKWIGVEMGQHFHRINLPRMKWTLIGNQVGVSKTNKFKGGGFFKYYELEQYEEVLSRAKYQWQNKEGKNQVEQYSFMQDQKLLDAIEIDYKNKNAKVVFENLYPDVDIAETLSNVSGKHIKQIFEDKVVFEDGSEVVYAEMTFEKYPWIKPLIWWNSK